MKKSEESSDSDRSLQKFLRKRDARVLREYYSGVPAETLHRRYGMSLKRIKELSEQYRSGKIDIFDERDKYAIEMSRKDDKERIRELESKVRSLESAVKMSNIKISLESAVKMSNIKIEGYEYMLRLLKEEEGIDLLKKAGAGLSASSSRATEK